MSLDALHTGKTAALLYHSVKNNNRFTALTSS